MDPAPLGHGPLSEERRTVVVADPQGLHARPCARLARTAQRFRSAAEVLHGGRRADARSVLALLELGVLRPVEVEVRAEGTDAAACVAALAAVLGSAEGG